MFLKNKNIIFKIRRSKVTDYAALSFLFTRKNTLDVKKFPTLSSKSLWFLERVSMGFTD